MIQLRTLAGLIASAPFVIVACSKSSSDTPTPSTTSASASASATSAASSAPTAALALSLMPSANMSIGERFASEAMHRPPGLTVRVEPTTAAFRKAGIALTDEKQHLGNSFLANFCVGAKAKTDEVTFSICEYDNDAKATEGAAMNDKTFKAIKNRHTHRNGATTLTILEAVKNDENDAIVKKLIDIFQAQKPSALPGADGGTASSASASTSALAAPSAAPSK